MKMIYVAGPYRSESPEGVQQNIKAAQTVGAIVAQRGWHPVVPHNMSAGLEALGDEYWLDATMALMQRCDGVVLVPGHETSEGTQAEIVEALSRDMPVYELEDLPEFRSLEDQDAILRSLSIRASMGFAKKDEVWELLGRMPTEGSNNG